MLVSQRRQNAYHFQPPPPIDIPTTSSQPQHANPVFDNSLLPTPPLYTPQPIDQKLLQSYLASTAQLPYSNSVLLPETPNVEQYMTTTFAYPQPDIRIQQSTPTPQYDVQYEPQYAPSPISIDSAIGLDCYPYESETPMSGSSLQTPGFAQQSRSHQRFPSSSSVASSAPASPRNPHGLAAPHMRSYSNSDYTPPVSATLKFESSQDDTSRRFSNHLPTPTDTPLQDSFAANPQYQNLNFSGDSMDSAMAATMAYNHGLMMENSNNGDDDVPGFSHSARHSVSSYGHDSPATPHTTSGDDFDDGFKVPHNDVRPNLPNVPKFDRTMSDIYQDELYNPQNMNTAPVSVAPKPKLNTKLLSPFRHNINERLQAAQSARSQSPSSVTSGGVSPFRQGSPLAPSNSFGSPLGLHITGQQREQAMAEARRTALRQQQQQQQTQAEPKTISPKEAMLDYQPSAEDAKMPLFPDEASDYASQYSQATSSFGNGNYDNVADQKFSNLSTPNENSWSESSRASSTNYSQTPTSVPSQPTFNFSAPSQSQSVHGMPFQDQYHLATNETPEFPAHLTSMESSASEAPPASSQGSNGHGDIQRPKSTQANGGTYTCTYHGCSQRFETPQKLQKHKREGHRQNATPVTPDVGSGMTSAALLARNSQAGPHKCDRINPTTGKPCNTIFSRPYDLTRHEDTIHNARKQKVRCALCVEEKTFSRNDALTRHMRVVHPEVDFPGKHRRRGAHD